jgi:DNA-binding MarR family transcriptional regulator
MANIDRGRAQIAAGLSNHRRIQIIRQLITRGNMCINDVAVECGIDIATASQHAKRLHEAGLVKKRNEGRRVHLHPTKRATSLLATLDMLWEAPAD